MKLPPIESFFLRYLQSSQGIAECIETQLYETLLPPSWQGCLKLRETELFAFDPEALNDHPKAHLLHPGSPLLETLLKQAQNHAQTGCLYFQEDYLFPFDLEKTLYKQLNINEPLSLKIQNARGFYHPLLYFLFQITYTSDEKEQLLLPISLDGYTHKRINFLSQYLKSEPFTSQPSLPLPVAPSLPYQEALKLAEQACEQKEKHYTTLLNQRLILLFEKEEAQIHHYFNTLEKELQEKQNKGGDIEKIQYQIQATQLEKEKRLIDLKKKRSLKKEVALCHFLKAYQPKLHITATICAPSKICPLTFIWNPKLHKLEALACPNCSGSTFELVLLKTSAIGCPLCKNS